jgi:hypothetical protein
MSRIRRKHNNNHKNKNEKELDFQFIVLKPSNNWIPSDSFYFLAFVFYSFGFHINPTSYVLRFYIIYISKTKIYQETKDFFRI